MRELRKGSMPEAGKAFGIAGGIGPRGPFADIGRSAEGVSNLRSIPPRTSTGVSRGFSSTEVSPGFSRREYGAPSVGGNHSRPRPTAPRPSTPFIPEIMEPLVDVFDEGDRILVIAEVPGVEENSIGVELEDHTLRIQAAGKHRRYRGEVGLPAEVQPNGLAWTLNNGIIELRLKRRKRKRKTTRSRSTDGQ